MNLIIMIIFASRIFFNKHLSIIIKGITSSKPNPECNWMPYVAKKVNHVLERGRVPFPLQRAVDY